MSIKRKYPVPKTIKKAVAVIAFIPIITGIFTAAMAYFARDEGQDFMSVWLPTWAMVALLIAPIGFIMLILIDKILDALMPNGSKALKSFLQGVIMALLIEAFMATITTYQVNGFEGPFMTVWTTALMAGLPLAAVASVIVTLFVKPRVEAFLRS